VIARTMANPDTRIDVLSHRFRRRAANRMFDQHLRKLSTGRDQSIFTTLGIVLCFRTRD
jgi:hypothetical protein